MTQRTPVQQTTEPAAVKKMSGRLRFPPQQDRNQGSSGKRAYKPICLAGSSHKKNTYKDVTLKGSSLERSKQKKYMDKLDKFKFKLYETVAK